MNEEERRFKILEIERCNKEITKENSSIKRDRNHAIAFALAGIFSFATTYYLYSNSIIIQDSSWITSLMTSISENPIEGYILASGYIALSTYALLNRKNRISKIAKLKEKIEIMNVELNKDEENTRSAEKVKSIGPR